MSDTTMRNADLRQMLIERRRELQDDVRRGIRVGRADRPNDGRDVVDASDAHVQGDAVRCQACEERRENAQVRVRQLAQPRASFSLFPDVVGF